jgi:predicted Zn finger-like uncharacterized protein
VFKVPKATINVQVKKQKDIRVMFTQCQYCLTMFRITPEQLKAADGKVRCCQCNNVFNALHNLMESPTSFSNVNDLQAGLAETDRNEIAAVSASQLVHGETGSDGLVIESGLVSDSEVEKSLDALADEESPIESFGEESILHTDADSSEIDSQNQILLERDDGLETEPDYFAAGTESQMSELLDRDSTSMLLEDKGDDEQLAEIISLGNRDKESGTKTKAQTSNDDAITKDQPVMPSEEPFYEEQSTTSSDESLPGEVSLDSDESDQDQPIVSDQDLEQEPAPGFIPPGYADVSIDESLQSQEPLDDETRFTFEEEYEKPQPNRFRGYWAVASLLLLLPLGAQISWYLRDTLVTHYAGRQILQGICGLAGCEVPVRRDTEQIIISNRALTAHPEKEDVLSLKLEMVNTATFQQPFPKLQLSLYNDMGEIIARRTFLPDEYKTGQYRANQMMPISKAVHVALELQDPGKEVTGFKFDFL